MIEGFYLIAAGVLFYYLVRIGLRLFDILATKLEERKGAKYQKKEH